MSERDSRIPSSISSKLNELFRRFRRVMLLKGLAATVAVFLATMLASVALDRMFIMPFALRLAITLAAVALTAAAAWRFWVRPWLARPGSVDLAATVEVEHPELEERVSSTIEFVTQEERPEYRGSQEMMNAVAAQAVTGSAKVDFAEVVSAERARKSTIAASFLLLVTSLIAIIWWGDFSQSVERFAMPWANVARISSTVITVGEPADKFVARGDAVQIAASVSPAASEATLYLEAEPGRWVAIKMTSSEPGSFSHRLSEVASSMRYYVRAGDGQTRRYDITAVDRPQVARIDVRYDYPEYTGRSAKVEPNATGDVRAVAGTRVTLTVTASKPLEKGRLEMTEALEPVVMKSVGPKKFEARFTLAVNGQYVPRLEDDYGFTNQDEDARQIVADPDSVPVVTIVAPEGNVKLHSAATLSVDIAAKDDFGLASVSIVYTVNDGAPKSVVVPMKTANPLEDCETFAWALDKLGLKPGDMVTYRARAEDFHPAPPGVGFSESRTILITSPDYATDKEVREKNLQEVKKTIEELKEKLETAEKQEQALDARAHDFRPSPEVEKRKDQAKEALKQSEPLAKDLTEMLKKDPFLEAQAPKAESIEKENIPEAEKANDKVEVTKPLQESKPQIEKAEAETAEAIKKLDQMADEVAKVEKQEEEERKLADLADKEQKLADQADKTPPDQKENAEQLADKQDELKKDLDKMTDPQAKQDAVQQAQEDVKAEKKDLDALIDKEKDLKQRTDDAMKQKLDELTKRQEDLNKEAAAEKDKVQPKLDDRQAGQVPEDEMKKAAEAMKENKLADAVDQQKKAEDKMKDQAEALDKPAAAQENKPEQPAAPDQAKKMKDIADKQEQIRRELADLAGIPQPDKKMEDLAKKQEQLKKDTEDLEKAAQPEANAEQPHGEKAPADMQQAADDMKGAAPEKAPDQQEKAAGQLDDLAKNLDKQAEAKPDAAKPLADKARDLAKKQRDLKKETEAALPPKDENVQKLADEQQKLEDMAKDLAQQLDETAADLADAAPDAGAQAQKAEQAMQNAPKQMDNAKKNLDAAKAEPAKGDEQKAIDAMEQASAEAGKLEDQLAKAAEAGKPESGKPENGKQMAKAGAEMKQASKDMRGQDTPKGAKEMQQAAADLAQAAAQTMQASQKPGEPKESFKGSGRQADSTTGADQSNPKALKLTAEEWNRLPGELKQQLLQAMQGNYPEEYRQLIRDYFTSIAKTGAKVEGK